VAIEFSEGLGGTHAAMPVARTLAMRRNSHDEELRRRVPVNEAEREALYQNAPRTERRWCAAERVATCALQRSFDCRLKPNARPRATGGVVLDFVQQLRLCSWQEANRNHFAAARALAKTSSAEIA
jgi:hypothetical protein